MINAKVQELKKMFNLQYAFYKSTKPKNNSQRLLLFYAVECGLKVLILNKIKGHTTESFTKHEVLKEKLTGNNGHNIKYMLSFLQCNVFLLPELKCLNGYCAQPKEYNQIWRYGIVANLEAENQIEKELGKIAEWIGVQI